MSASRRRNLLLSAGAALALEGEYDLSDQVLTVAARLEASSCEFRQIQPHEWYCDTHAVLMVAGTSEPVYCSLAAEGVTS